MGQALIQKYSKIMVAITKKNENTHAKRSTYAPISSQLLIQGLIFLQ